MFRRWLLSSFSYIKKTFVDNFNTEIFMDIETPFESYNPLNQSYNFLIEGIYDLANKFPKIPEKKLRKFMALDPA